MLGISGGNIIRIAPSSGMSFGFVKEINTSTLYLFFKHIFYRPAHLTEDTVIGVTILSKTEVSIKLFK